MKSHYLGLILLAGCGSGDGSTDAATLADAMPTIDAMPVPDSMPLPDAFEALRGPATVRVISNEAAVANVPVLFHKADGTFEATVRTGADGRATGDVDREGIISVIRNWNDVTPPTSPLIAVFYKVKPGDTITSTNFGVADTRTGTMRITFPSLPVVSGTATYQAVSSCGTSGMTAATFPSGCVVGGGCTALAHSCSAGFLEVPANDMIALYAVAMSAGNLPLAYALRPAPVAFAVGDIAVTGGFPTAWSERGFAYSQLTSFNPTATSRFLSSDFSAVLADRRVPMPAGSAGVSMPASGAGAVSRWVPDDLKDDVLERISVSAPSATLLFIKAMWRRGALVPTAILGADFIEDIELVAPDTTDPARPIVKWKTTQPMTTAFDAGAMRVGAGNVAGTTSFELYFPGDQTDMKIPELPTEFAGGRPTAAPNTFRIVIFEGSDIAGWDAARNRSEPLRLQEDFNCGFPPRILPPAGATWRFTAGDQCD